MLTMKVVLRVVVTFALFCAAVSLSLADRTVPLRIIGVDATCQSFTPGATSSDNTATCVPTNTPPPPGAPTGCVATVNGVANVSFGSNGGAANLSSSCATPSSGIGYTWSKNGTSGISSSQSWTDTLPANASPTNAVISSYQVRACVVAACVTVPISPLTATVAATGGGGYTGTCPGYTNTINLDFGWTSQRLTATNMGINDVIVAKFTSGNIDSPSNNLPRISGAEWQSPPSARYAVLSRTPCDFSGQTWPGAITAGNSIQVPFAVGTGSNWNYYPIVPKNTVMYLNVRNLSPNESCSNQGQCQMFIELNKGNL